MIERLQSESRNLKAELKVVMVEVGMNIVCWVLANFRDRLGNIDFP